MSKYTLKEEEICSRFAELATSVGFTVYPETGGWDQLMVWEKEDTDLFKGTYRKKGFVIAKDTQIGIQAKARPNFVVIKQSIEYRRAKLRPHYIAVLVPKFVDGFDMVCMECGIIPFTHELKPIQLIQAIHMGRYEKRKEDGLIWTPSIVPNLPAGVSGPKQLTKWKEGALILSWLLRNRGYISSRDFTFYNIDITLWRRNNWIKRDGNCAVIRNGHMSSMAKYVLGSNIGPESEFPDIGWETTRDRIAEELNLKELK